MAEPNFKNREIFKVGKWRASSGPVEATSEMLDEIVASYAALNSKVTGYAIPIKLGHNRRVGEPAMGYAENVRREGDTLIADFVDMPPEIVDAVRTKRYNAVSVEIWPTVTYDEAKFSNVLSGVALLGAEWPAVKGLAPVYASELATDGEPLTLSQEEETMHFTQEQHDALVAAAVEKAISDTKASFAKELTDAQTALAAAEAARDTAQAALGVFAEDAEKSAIAAVIEKAEKDGKIVPANKERIASFAETLRKAVSKPEDRKAALATFKEFVEALPKKVDFSEHGRSNSERAGDEEASAGAEVVKRAKALMAAEKITYPVAMAKVFEADGDLKARYLAENGRSSSDEDEDETE